ncbi:MAG: YHS domain-containing protein [Candidatus Saganbacteria bacterium]|nr:YHS domain-containing protein [Candidatus Saganbacteria bacterium]
MAKDVICGMDVEEGKNEVEYNGEKFSFCAPACKAKFEQDPEKYIKK